MRNFLGLLVVISTLFGCKENTSEENTNTEASFLIHTPEYAQFFEINENHQHIEIKIKSPWDSSILLSEVNIDKENLPKNIVVMGAPYVGILNKLNKINLIKGVDKKSNYYNLYVISNPAIAEIGDEKHLDVEWLLSNNIDLVIVSAFPTKPDNLIKMEEKGIKVLCLPEWMENSPLARAEWIKVFGALTNQTDLSNEIFKTIKHNYQYLVNEYKTDTTYKSVLMGNNFKGTWYTPGGKSYMANLVYDAGGNYYWSKDTSTGSLSVSFEEVLANQQNADIWINPDRYNSINDLISDDSRYKYFKAVKTHKVYANTKRISKTGGNDFWESGIIMPEVILSDIHTILFDDEVYHEDLYFYKQLP